MYVVTLLAYRALLWLCTPLVALALAVHPRARGGRRERWGFVRPEVEPGAVWIHAASLGEGRVAAALIPELRSRASDLEVLRTCTSATARSQAVGADQTLFLPLDHPLAVRAFLARVRPRCLVLVEAELWPILLAECRSRRIPVAVVNARLGVKQRRWMRLWWVWSGLIRDIRWTAPDRATAKELGGIAVGDVKGQADPGTPSLRWTRPCVIGGSTHAGDEAALLEAVSALDPRPLLILAPRDPRRFEAVWTLIRATGRVARRRTGLDGAAYAPIDPAVDVLLLDTVGELTALYIAADVAFVGGTWDEGVGGHSPAEAVAAGCQVVHGPKIQANPGAWEGVAGFVARTPDALASALEAAMAAPRPGRGGSTGAVRATLDAIAELLVAPVPPETVLRPWLLPLTPLWALGVALRSALSRPRRTSGSSAGSPGRPTSDGTVISVGALSAGGTGKTPVTAWIAATMNGVVLSRGYGRDASKEVHLAGEADRLGDELAMLARRGMTVVSSPDRTAGVTAALTAAKAGDLAPVVVLDDGLQVTSLARNLDIVVVDARFPGGDGLIPAGTRRLPLSWLRRADVLWINHANAETPVPNLLAPYLPASALVVRASYRPTGWIFRGQRLPLDAIPRRPVAAFAGIARPEGFFRQLRRLGLSPAQTWIFPDHHRYGWSDLQSFESWRDTHVLVTTEKDAARLPREESVWALCLQVEIHSGEAELLARLRRLGPPTGGA